MQRLFSLRITHASLFLSPITFTGLTVPLIFPTFAMD